MENRESQLRAELEKIGSALREKCRETQALETDRAGLRRELARIILGFGQGDIIVNSEGREALCESVSVFGADHNMISGTYRFILKDGSVGKNSKTLYNSEKWKKVQSNA